GVESSIECQRGWKGDINDAQEILQNILKNESKRAEVQAYLKKEGELKGMVEDILGGSDNLN
ncbi:MAG: hypothetical protein ACK55Z_10570, partial [bacterium]